MGHMGKNTRLIRQITKKLDKNGWLEKTEAGLTADFMDTGEKPLFISEYPFDDGKTIFDYYFNLDSSMWVKFDIEKNLNAM